MLEDVRVHKGNCFFSGPRGVTAEAVRQRAVAECSKGVVYAYMPPLLLTYHALYSAGYINPIQNRPHNCCGPAKVHDS
jgi:hypothetical protein